MASFISREAAMEGGGALGRRMLSSRLVSTPTFVIESLPNMHVESFLVTGFRKRTGVGRLIRGDLERKLRVGRKCTEEGATSGQGCASVPKCVTSQCHAHVVWG